MKKPSISDAVHSYIAEFVGHDDFADDVSLSSLGLDRDRVQRLLVRVEEDYPFTARPSEQERLLGGKVTVEQLIEFLRDLR